MPVPIKHCSIGRMAALLFAFAMTAVAGRGYVMVHAASDGEKVVHLPCACDVREIFGASPAINGVTLIAAQMKRGETRVWRIAEK